MSTSSLHSLLLLSDSALPLGSFAFSSGLESYLAHQKAAITSTSTSTSSTNNTINTSPLFDAFLAHSVSNLASTALPYVLTAHNDPDRLASLDNDLDASTPCTVARRASVAQGRALSTIWTRALEPQSSALDNDFTSSDAIEERRLAATKALSVFSDSLKPSAKNQSSASASLGPNAHFAPLFGTVCAALGISAQDTAYVFLLNHTKAILSAAVRAGVMGPYQSQGVLAGADTQKLITACVERERLTSVEDAGVSVPSMDLWAGRHELLYSRIFNS